ncbi:MAG TPA: DUF3857 domain-containing protein [Verrucomicrobiae bacterium]|nr:DUF3857 domain-containing protein [Verrucomicrobiae bacterium]
MTSEPLAPGAPAIILYREVYRDDCGVTCHSAGAGFMSADRLEEDYFRIKILTEAGRKYGDIEIPLPSEVGSITNINARTIRPDGSIINFSGQIFDKTIVKAKGIHYRARTFSMPDVQVGSIIEYYYTINFTKGLIFFSNWVLSQDLFTRKAKCSLRYYQSNYYTVSFRWSEHLPPGTPSPVQKGDFVELEAANIPAFQAEDFMPPENEYKSRVDFVYSWDAFEQDPNKFWKTVGKSRNSDAEKFVGKRGAMEQAVSQIVSPSDPPELKLRKLYVRVQQLHNTSYEVQKTEQEQQRENPNPNQNVEDVWKRGSGSGWDLTWLYLALVRAAGFEAYPVLVADRQNFFFNSQSMQSGRLDSNLVLVKLNGKDLYLDPGAAFTPFGMLNWTETGVTGLRLDKDGGSWVQTTLPESSASQILRKADLKLSTNGDLEGKLVVTFTGLEGQRRRLDERNDDDTARKKVLEDEVKSYIPAGSEVELTKQPDWTNSDVPLIAEFTLRVPGWISLAGRRAVCPIGIFGGTEKHVFDHSDRVYPVYFEFLSQVLDDISVELPPGWQITSLPQPQDQELRVVAYAVSAENNKGVLHLTRKLDINVLMLDLKYYSPLRSFFQIVRAGDDQQAILLPATATSSN